MLVPETYLESLSFNMKLCMAMVIQALLNVVAHFFLICNQMIVKLLHHIISQRSDNHCKARPK